MSPPDELVVVAIHELDLRWYAVYCPRRRRVIGPMSPSHRTNLQQWYRLVDGDDGLEHLRYDFLPGSTVTSCGRPADDSGHEIVDDLFAGWALGRVCRDCLLVHLPEVVDEWSARWDGDAGPQE
jgi:hypothetical protein